MKENDYNKTTVRFKIKVILTLIFWAIFFRTIFLMNDIQIFADEFTSDIYSYKSEELAGLYLKRNHKGESLYVDDISNYRDKKKDFYDKYIIYDNKELELDQDIFLIGDRNNSDIEILLFKDKKTNTYSEEIVFKQNDLIINDIFSSIDFEEFNLSRSAENHSEYNFKQYVNSKITLDSKYDIDFFNTHLKVEHKESFQIKPNTIASKTNIAPNNLDPKYLDKLLLLYNYTYIENYIKHLVKEIHKNGYSLDLYSFDFEYYQRGFPFEHDNVIMKLSISNLTEDDILSDNFYQILKEKLVIYDAEYAE